jgi:peptide/nickel transport system permease protein
MTAARSGELSLAEQQARSAPSPLAGEGRGGGSESSPELRQPTTTPTHDPSPTQVGPARLAQDEAEPGQARVPGGGEHTESAASLYANLSGTVSTPTAAHNTGIGAAALASEASAQRGHFSEVRAPDTRPGPGSSARAMLRHARYILGENAVTGFAFALFLLIVLAALIGPYIVPYDPLASDTAAALKGPSAAHWFGTDQLGRDVFSRVVVATRLDVFIAVASVALVFLMGGLAGVAAGFFGGWTDRIVGRIADTIMAFPLFVLAMGIVAALGNTVQNIVLATAIVNFPLYARVARAEANVRREAGFVQAARLCGNGDVRILLGQILPNIMPIMVVQMSLTMGYAILNAAGLSFIGLGVRPPTAEWGIMVADGAAFMVSGEWWIAFFPGAALMIAVFCFNLLGDGLRDIVDPQRRT